MCQRQDREPYSSVQKSFIFAIWPTRLFFIHYNTAIFSNIFIQRRHLCHSYLHFLYKYTVCYNIFTLFFKKRTQDILHESRQGGLPKSFFIDNTPPLPPPYCVIALLLRAIILWFCRDTLYHAATPGSLYENFSQ